MEFKGVIKAIAQETKGLRLADEKTDTWFNFEKDNDNVWNYVLKMKKGDVVKITYRLADTDKSERKGSKIVTFIKKTGEVEQHAEEKTSEKQEGHEHKDVSDKTRAKIRLACLKSASQAINKLNKTYIDIPELAVDLGKLTDMLEEKVCNLEEKEVPIVGD